MSKIKSHYTCPHCCQLIELEVEGIVTKVNKVSTCCGQKGEVAGLKGQVSAQPEEPYPPLGTDKHEIATGEKGVQTNVNRDAF